MIRVEYDYEPEYGRAFTVTKGHGRIVVHHECLEDGQYVRHRNAPEIHGPESIMVEVAIAIIRRAGAEEKAIAELSGSGPHEQTSER